MSSSPSDRRLRRIRIGMLAGLLTIGAAAWVWLTRPEPRPIADHWGAVKQARAHLERGRPDLALAAVQHARDDKPGAAEAMRIAGEALLAMKDHTSARKAFERSLQLDPNQPKAAVTVAALCLSMSDAPRGLEYLKLAVRLEPKNPRNWRSIGIVYDTMGEPENAADAFREGLKLDPDDWPLRINLIAKLLDVHRDDEAETHLNEGDQRKPNDPLIAGLRARLRFAQGRLDEARRCSDQALREMPQNLDALKTRYQIARQQGREADARGDLVQILEIDSNDLGSLQALAQIEKGLGRDQAAADALKRYQETRDRKTAMDQLTREISERADDPDPRYRLGQLAIRLGQPTLAKQSFESALYVDPKHQPSRDALRSLEAVPQR